MDKETFGGFPNNMYGSNTEWPRPPSNPVASSFANQHITYPQVGWNYGSSSVNSEAGTSGHNFQNHYAGWGNAQGMWNNNQGFWNTSQGSWNSNQAPWNMGPHLGPPMTRAPMTRAPMTRGPPPMGGRPMWTRGFGGGSRFSGPARPQLPQGGDHFCDSCERGFMTPEELMNHQHNDHVVCGLEGCTLSAHPKIVEKHQRMQHESGLYSRLGAASSQNPEDVQKWIAERKKNYPTKANVDRRKQEEEECQTRGESLSMRRGSRFGRPRGGAKRRGRDFSEGGRSWRDGGHRGGRGFGRGMHKRRFDGRGGRHPRQIRGRRLKKMPLDRRLAYGIGDEPRDVPMFPGTAYLLGVPLDKNQSSDEEQEDVAASFSDSEWVEEKKKQEEETPSVDAGKDERLDEDKEGMATESSSIALTNALGALMGTYASDDSDEDAPPVQAKTQCNKGGMPNDDGPKVGEQVAGQDLDQVEKSSTSAGNGAFGGVVPEEGEEEESDGSAPEEVVIVRGGTEEGKGSDGVAEGQGPGEEEVGGGGEGGGSKNRKGRKRKRGKGNSEVTKDGGESPPKSPVSDPKRPREQRTYDLPPREPTLLEELLKNEIRHERNVILQCIRYVIQRNFFDPAPIVQVGEENSANSKEDKTLSAEDDSNAAASDSGAEKCSAMNA